MSHVPLANVSVPVDNAPRKSETNWGTRRTSLCQLACWCPARYIGHCWCLKLPQPFSCETWQYFVFMSPGYGIFRWFRILFYSSTALLSPLNMAEYCQQKIPQCLPMNKPYIHPHPPCYGIVDDLHNVTPTTKFPMALHTTAIGVYI